MSRGFRDADATQAMSDQAVAEAIGKILERDGASGRGDGLCVECGLAISAERLEVLPDAARCVGCQSKWAKRRR